MSKLKEQIPDKFYSMFASEKRPIYIDYLVAIFTQVSKNSRYAFKGMTKLECKDIVNTIGQKYLKAKSSDSVLDDEELIALDENNRNHYIRNLISFGWLDVRYDDERGEELITVPDYSRLFISVFMELDKDVDNSANDIARAYASLYTWNTASQDNLLLNDALVFIQGVNISLTSMAKVMEGKISEMIANATNRVELLNELLDIFDAAQKGGYGESTLFGKFKTYNLNIKQIASKARKKSLSTLDALEENIRMASPEEAEKIEKDIEKNRYIYETLKEIGSENAKAEALYQEAISQMTRAALRAQQKYIYLDARDTISSQNRLLQVITLLSKEREENGKECADGNDTRRIDSACGIFGFPETPYSILDRELYIPQTSGRNAGSEYIQKTNSNQANAGKGPAKPKFSSSDLDEFESEKCLNGHFTANSDTIVTLDDQEKLLYLLADRAERKETKGHIKVGKLVIVEEGFAFTELDWEVHKEE